jgi:hypothetical protein
MTRWKRAGGNVLHLVQTVPHYNHQPLRQVLEGFMAARRFQRNRKTWKRIAGDIELAGIVRGLETTYGENGWHVHSHELLYVKSDRFDKQDLGELESRVLPTWESACVSAGLGLPNSRGVVIQDGSYAAKYAAKWGLESEVTKGHIKRGRDGNSSPWDLLRGIAEGVTEYQGLFQEYARAFKGRHQLEWSRGLRKMLEMEEEESDADLAEEEEEGAELLGMLTFDQWRVVLRKDRRAELLGVAEREGWRGVLAYISGLVGMREPGQEGWAMKENEEKDWAKELPGANPDDIRMMLDMGFTYFPERKSFGITWTDEQELNELMDRIWKEWDENRRTAGGHADLLNRGHARPMWQPERGNRWVIELRPDRRMAGVMGGPFRGGLFAGHHRSRRGDDGRGEKVQKGMVGQEAGVGWPSGDSDLHALSSRGAWRQERSLPGIELLEVWGFASKGVPR